MKVKSILYLVAMVGLMLSFRVSAHAQEFDPEARQVADITTKLADMKLKEGLNLIDTLATGVRIEAKVEKGKIVGWVFTDKKGRVIERTAYTNKKGKRAKERIRCWECFKGTDGEQQCVSVSCPFH